ncbi:MAG: GNAT family N-acetyltransferase [Pelagibaca sp.]
MQVKQNPKGLDAQISQLFKDTFIDSEGVDEGLLIHDLARDLLSTTPPEDIRVFVATEDGTLCGTAIFTRLRFGDDPRIAFLLSPMAVATTRQGQGLGTQLLTDALNVLRRDGADIAVTYGDPAYYARVGFGPVTQDILPAPLPLSMPEGWIAQSLTDTPLTPLPGPSVCVPALARPDVW